MAQDTAITTRPPARVRQGRRPGCRLRAATLLVLASCAPWGLPAAAAGRMAQEREDAPDRPRLAQVLIRPSQGFAGQNSGAFPSFPVVPIAPFEGAVFAVPIPSLTPFASSDPDGNGGGQLDPNNDENKEENKENDEDEKDKEAAATGAGN